MTDEIQKEGATAAKTDNKKTMGLICMLVNILGPFVSVGLGVGVGGIIYGATQKATDPSTEKFFKNGLIQLIVAVSCLIVGIACPLLITAATLGAGILIGWVFWIFFLGPAAMYIWSIVDAVNLYTHSQT